MAGEESSPGVAWLVAEVLADGPVTALVWLCMRFGLVLMFAPVMGSVADGPVTALVLLCMRFGFVLIFAPAVGGVDVFQTCLSR